LTLEADSADSSHELFRQFSGIADDPVVGVTTPQLGRGRLHGLRVLIAEDAWILAETSSTGRCGSRRKKSPGIGSIASGWSRTLADRAF
jgi:hypothetical protein